MLIDIVTVALGDHELSARGLKVVPLELKATYHATVRPYLTDLKILSKGRRALRMHERPKGFGGEMQLVRAEKSAPQKSTGIRVAFGEAHPPLQLIRTIGLLRLTRVKRIERAFLTTRFPPPVETSQNTPQT